MLERQGHYTSSHKRSSTVGTTYKGNIKLEALLVGWSEATVARPGTGPGPFKNIINICIKIIKTTIYLLYYIRKIMSKIKSDWRYVYVGEDCWMLDNPGPNVEDTLIDLIDGVPEPAEGPNVHLALEVISEKYRLLLIEYFFEGKTLEQMGNSRSKTKQYMHQELKKALVEIKSILNKQNSVP